MKVLFAIASEFLSEPLGVMQLIAIAKASGHDARLLVLARGDLAGQAVQWRPDVVAYSAMTPSLDAFREEDRRLLEALPAAGRRPFRIMGGPHPTFSPEVIDELGLDAICQGDGDRALPALLARLEGGRSLEDIPNIGLSREGARTRELFAELDSLPFADRRDYYRILPLYREMGGRSFVASRGCPYECTYCFNHAFNEMFRGCGRIVRRRSVENVLREIEFVRQAHPPLRFVRFADDTFAHKADAWLEEFADRYPRRIGVPFYCLMRSNTMTDESARLLARAGCHSVGMSLETGNEEVRNGILKRHLSDADVERSFEVARRHGLRTYTNTMLGIPGTGLGDDLASLEFTRRVRPSAATFTICCPYPKTKIWEFAREKGYLDARAGPAGSYMDLSSLNAYSRREKEIQARMCYLGALYCFAPAFLLPLLRLLFRLGFGTRALHALGMLYAQYRLTTRVFPGILPRRLGTLVGFVRAWMAFFSPRRAGARPPAGRALARGAN